MKKILLIIPVVFCLVLSSLSIIPVHAANYLQTPAESYEGASCMVHPLDNLLEVAGNPKYYFWYNTYRIKDDDKYQIETKFIYYDDEINVEEDNGVYTINFLGSSGYNLISVEHDSLPDYDFKSGASNTDVLKTIILDSNTNDLSRVRDNGEIVSYITEGFSFNVFETNMFEADSGDLTFEFFPELIGEISNSVEMDGKTFNYPYLQVDVHNKTSDYYQYAIFIVEKGTQITFRDDYTSAQSKSGYFFTNKAVYCYITDEWFRTKISVGSSDPSTIRPLPRSTLVYAPSAWHRSRPKNATGLSNEDIPLAIGWNQLNLVPNVEYDVVCLACPIDEITSGENNNSDYYIDCYPQRNGVEPREYYRSTFTVSKAMPYDSNNNSSDFTSNHVYGFDSENPSDVFDNLAAYVSPDKKLVANNQKFSGDILPPGHSTNNYNFSSYQKIDSFSSSFQNVFGFITTFLNYLPDGFLGVFSFGFTALIIIVIIKAVRS